MGVARKRKEQVEDICKGTPDIEFEQDWSVGKLKTIFLVSRIFSGKADSVILLGFECTINTQYLNKVVRAMFEKIEILNFFLCELPLILGVCRKWKGWTGEN